MKPAIVLLGLAAGALALAAASSSSASSPAPPPSIGGLTKGQWYRLTVRSSISREVFDTNAAFQQSQTLLGREGFDVRAATADASDPFVYALVGIYRGDKGAMSDAKGVILLHAEPIAPQTIPNTPDHIDARPVALTPGVTYFGRASISWPLSMLVTRDAVVSHLQAEGFTDVVVVFDADKLGAEWPATERGGDLFVQATYAGAPTSVDVPSQVVSVWK